MDFSFLDLIFPPRCVLCRVYLGHGQALCGDCRRQIVIHRSFFCGKCRARIYFPGQSCHRNFPFLLAAAGEYTDWGIKTLIHDLKFKFVRAVADHLGIMLATYARRLRMIGKYDAVVPVPLGRRRERERGFNQSELIARAFAARTGAMLETRSLRRVRQTQPQSGLHKAAARQKNVAGCFEVYLPGKINGRNIILLDDVITSGATLCEAATVLKAAGAKSILALVMAKA